MENKIANWVELGVMPYSETMQIQDRFVDMRRKNLVPDTILSVQHPLTVNFGADERNNQFSELLLAKVLEGYGNINHESIFDYLKENNIDFSISSRGGGATVFAPGQFVFYPIVNHLEVTGSHQLDIGAYKSVIYRTLFDSLKNLGVMGINTGGQLRYDTRDERRDAWIVREGITHKMGSKGIVLKRGVAYHGFALNITKESVSKSWMANQCGYKPSEVKLWSVEHELGRIVDPDEAYGAVQRAMISNFGYAGFQKMDLKELEVKHGN